MHFKEENSPAQLEFDDNRLLPLLYGEADKYLSRIEKKANVTIVARGNQLAISGEPPNVTAACVALEKLYSRLQLGMVVSGAEVDAAVRLALATEKEFPSESVGIVTNRRTITPRSAGQSHYMQTLKMASMVFAVGPAGTGKTYLAVAQAVALLLQGRIDRIILSRPAVEAGERLGFLPGDLKEKVDPYLRPLYDALQDLLPSEKVTKLIETGSIEIAPLAFMRGRTLSHAYIILDEAQNTTIAQMKMFLTRMGEGSYMAITGDLTQIDLPVGQKSGLKDAIDVLKEIPEIKFIYLTQKDVVRHSLVSRIVSAYEHQKITKKT